MTHSKPTLLAMCSLVAGLSLGLAGCPDDHDHDGDAHDDGHEHGDAGSVSHDDHTSCGLQENCTDTLEFMHGLEVEGMEGKFTATLMHGTDPMVSGSSWMITLADADGAAVTDATVTVSTWSVDCHHNGPTPPEDVTANAMGMYVVEPVFAHGGPWETRLAIVSGDTMDMVHIPLCIPGEDHMGGTGHDDRDAGQ